MDVVVLSYRGEPLREFALDGILEVGRSPHCDIVIHDRNVAPRELLIDARAKLPVYYRLSRPPTQRRRHALSISTRVPVGERFTLERVADLPARHAPKTPWTVPLPIHSRYVQTFSLLLGDPSARRRITVREHPIYIGSDEKCDLVLEDRTVSACHCRVERCGDRLRVVDMESRNGTWVDGVRSERVIVASGSKIRLGRTTIDVLARGTPGDARTEGLIAVSEEMLAVVADVERYAHLTWPLLILGESGTGKEAVARALHQRGPRAQKPFVAINAGGLPPELIESELFGHERGAFTGAVGAHLGVFEQAAGGTLFLDEIGELPLALQARLLRVLEEWRVRRVGGERSIPLDVRLVCATHRDVSGAVRDRTFREDLFYRIARLVVRLPPLRRRPEDIEALAREFLAVAEREVGRKMLSDDALAQLLRHRWPGNVRELRNVVFAAAANSPGERIEGVDVTIALRQLGVGGPSVKVTDQTLAAVVHECEGNYSAAARRLGIPRSTLRDRLRACRPEKKERAATGS
ncbi:MAG: sigma 54-interacting transcriptional regulator [Myxococcota bacterium]